MTDDIDASLAALLNSGWDNAPQTPAPAGAIVPQYPALPVRDVEDYLEPQPHGGALRRSEAVDVPPSDVVGAVMDIGLLADLAVGRTSAVEAAQRAGLTERELEQQLAVTLREVDPKEIAKAMGVQAAEQQLKSGAIYGAVLADLVRDMVTGRLKPDQKIELAKLLARVGRIEPKEDKGVGAGSGFVLNINLGAERPAPVTIDVD